MFAESHEAASEGGEAAAGDEEAEDDEQDEEDGDEDSQPWAGLNRLPVCGVTDPAMKWLTIQPPSRGIYGCACKQHGSAGSGDVSGLRQPTGQGGEGVELRVRGG